MDLRKKGLFFTLKKGMDLEPLLHKDYIAKGQYSKSHGFFEFPSGRYEVGVETGEGGYGTVMLGTRETDGSVYAIKILDIEQYSRRPESEFIRLGILQAVSHIVLEEESTNELDGPYVPIFHEIAYDEGRKYILLRTERMNDTLFFRFTASTPKENDTIVPRTVAHVAHILDFFQKRLAFNHRDLKPNNVMYNYSPSGEFQIKLIDFGWACMNYGGTEIKVREYFDDKDRCNLKSRDLTFLLWSIYGWCRANLTNKLKEALEFLLTFEADHRTCQLVLGCYAYGKSGYDRDTIYDFLNESKILNPKTIPVHVRDYMMRMLGISESKQSPLHSILSKRIPGLIYCAPTKMLNPKTRKCVNRNSAVGRSIIQSSKHILTQSKQRTKTRKYKPCKKDHYRDPFTRRCKKKPESS